MKLNKSSDLFVRTCLKSLGISLLSDWDALIFLHRHQASLVTADQIAHLLGYPSNTVADSLTRLESLGLIKPSRASQELRFYQFVISKAHLVPEGCFRRLVSLTRSRAGRLLIMKALRWAPAPRLVKEKEND